MIEERGWSVPEREEWCGKEVGGSAAQETGIRRKRGSGGGGGGGDRRGESRSRRQ